MAKGAATGVGRIRVLAKTGRRAGRGSFSSQIGRLDMRRKLDINEYFKFCYEIQQMALFQLTACTLGQPNFWGIFRTNSIIEFDPNRDSIPIFGSLGNRFTTTRERRSTPC